MRELVALCLAAAERPIDYWVSDSWTPPSWECPGVYQLIGPGYSYIGMSRNLRERMRYHFAPQSPFRGVIGSARALSMFGDSISQRDLRNAEAYWHQLLRPNLNIRPIPFVR